MLNLVIYYRFGNQNHNRLNQ